MLAEMLGLKAPLSPLNALVKIGLPCSVSLLWSTEGKQSCFPMIYFLLSFLKQTKEDSNASGSVRKHTNW